MYKSNFKNKIINLNKRTSDLVGGVGIDTTW